MTKAPGVNLAKACRMFAVCTSRMRPHFRLLLWLPLLSEVVQAQEPPSLPPAPLTPGFQLCTTAAELRTALLGASSGHTALFVPPGAHFFLGGVPLTVTCCNITIASEGGGATLNAANESRVFTVSQGAQLNLKRMHLINGADSVGGAGIYLDGTSDLTMSSSSISNCSSLAGAALFINKGHAVLNNCMFDHCSVSTSAPSAKAEGGALFVEHRLGSFSAIGCTFTGCTAFSSSSNSQARGAAVSLPYGSGLFSSCMINSCRAAIGVGRKADGGAIFAYDATVTMSDCIMSDCGVSSTVGANTKAGALSSSLGPVTLIRCTVRGCWNKNRALGGLPLAQAGALYVMSSSLSIDSCVIVDCVVESEDGQSQGSALFVASSPAVSVAGCLISRCTAMITGQGFVEGGAVFVNSAVGVSFSDCVMTECQGVVSGTGYVDGGMLYVRLSSASLFLLGCTFRGGGAFGEQMARGGVGFVDEGSLTAINCTMIGIVTESLTGKAAGGALEFWGEVERQNSRGTLVDCTIRDCVARAVTSAKGGAIAVWSAHLTLSGTRISDCAAVSVGNCSDDCFAGGGLINVNNGVIILQNETLLRNGTVRADHTGKVNAALIFSDSGAVSYLLPAPLGRWVPAVKCSITYQSCPATDSNCDRAALGTEGVAQQCPWSSVPALLGRDVHSVPIGGVDYTEYPFACGRGLFGSDSSVASQSGALCGGACPPGHVCAESGTTQPQQCPAGTSCEEGAAAPLLCTSGRYQPSAGQITCLPCPLGHECTAGSIFPTACAPGSFAAIIGSAACSRCSAGSFQPSANQTQCLSCLPGSACAAGAIEPTACAAGSFAASNGSALCTSCSGGSYQSIVAQTACARCAAGEHCARGSTVPIPCPGGTYSPKRGLTSVLGCLPVPQRTWAPTGSARPMDCPTSGFFCPGAEDVAAHTAANITPAGSQPIPLEVGNVASAPEAVTSEMPSVELTLTLEADLGASGLGSATFVTELAQLFGIAEELIEVTGLTGGSVVVIVRVAQESNTTLASRVSSVDDAVLSDALGVGSTISAVTFDTRNVTRLRIVQESCKPGYWCTAGAVIKCNVGFYNPDYHADRATACHPCPLHATTAGEASTRLADCFCEERYYDENVTLDGVSCVACPEEGVNCSASGSTLDRLPLESMYWRPRALSLEVKRCFSEGACLGGENMSAYCVVGRKGPFCDVCEEGYDRKADGSCEECGKSTANAWVLPAVVGGVAVMGILVNILRRLGLDRLDCLAETGEQAGREGLVETLNNWFAERFERTSMVLHKMNTKLKILLSLFQVLTTLGVVFDMPYLPTFDGIMVNFAFVSLDFVALTPIGCAIPMNFHTSLVLRTAVPLAIVLFIATVHACNVWRIRRIEARDDEAAAKAKEDHISWMSNHGTSFAFFLIFLIYPSTSATVLSFFQCYPVDDGHSYLRRDFSIDCNSDAHRAMTYYAIAMVFVYPLGVPLLYQVMFWVHGESLQLLQSIEELQAKLTAEAEAGEHYRHREEAHLRHESQRRLRLHPSEGADESADTAKGAAPVDSKSMPASGQSADFSTITASKLDKLAKEQEEGVAALPAYMLKLIDGYELRCYHFEIFESLRKLALVGVPVFFEPAGGVGQLTYALLIAFITFGAYTALAPYVDDGDDRLAQLGQVQIFFTLLSCVAMKTDRATTDSMDMLLSVMTFVPFTLAIILETPIADYFYAEERESELEFIQMIRNAARRLVSYLRGKPLVAGSVDTGGNPPIIHETPQIESFRADVDAGSMEPSVERKLLPHEVPMDVQVADTGVEPVTALAVGAATAAAALQEQRAESRLSACDSGKEAPPSQRGSKRFSPEGAPDGLSPRDSRGGRGRGAGTVLPAVRECDGKDAAPIAGQGAKADKEGAPSNRVAIASHSWDGEGTSGEAGGYLIFRKGAWIEVLEEGAADEWWRGRLNGKVGWFPSSFTKMYSFAKVHDMQEEELVSLAGGNESLGTVANGGRSALSSPSPVLPQALSKRALDLGLQRFENTVEQPKRGSPRDASVHV